MSDTGRMATNASCELAAVQRAFKRAEQMQEDARAEARSVRREAVLRALTSGMSSREVGKALGLSHTRVQRIAAGRSR